MMCRLLKGNFLVLCCFDSPTTGPFTAVPFLWSCVLMDSDTITKTSRIDRLPYCLIDRLPYCHIVILIGYHIVILSFVP